MTISTGPTNHCFCLQVLQYLDSACLLISYAAFDLEYREFSSSPILEAFTEGLVRMESEHFLNITREFDTIASLCKPDTVGTAGIR